MSPSLVLWCGSLAIIVFTCCLYYPFYPNLIAGMVIAFASGLVIAWWLMYEPPNSLKTSVPIPPQVSVSIKCSYEDLPLRIPPSDSLFAFRLHPKWGNQLVDVKGENPWPDTATSSLSGIGYKCEVINSGTVTVTGLVVPFRVNYRNREAKQPMRTFEIPISDELPAGKVFVLHIIDDTGWDPEVTIPAHIQGRIPGERQLISIPIKHSTTSGDPMGLTGFGPR